MLREMDTLLAIIFILLVIALGLEVGGWLA